ncbi:MAG: ATP synthase F0 subunit B [Acidobacteriota bacterium]|nr:ATP synthase F0 subunit B [Acidobacteriota bacterium]
MSSRAITLRAITLLAFALALMSAPLGLAQQHATPASPAPPASSPSSSPAQPAATPAPAHPGPSTSEPSTDKELVEASKEAETGKTAEHGEGKEEDEEAQFKYSASVQWLARHTGLSADAAYWLAISINFLIVAGFIGWAIKKSAPIHFRERTAAIRKQLEEARAASENANRRLAEIESRLARLDVEIAELRAASEHDAAAEEQRLRAAAEEDRLKVVAAAEQEILTAAKVARAELKRYTAELAIGLAEKKIQVTPQADQELVRGFADGLSAENRAAENRAAEGKS